MSYRLITSPEHVSIHELPRLEAELNQLSSQDLTALTPSGSGQSVSDLRRKLDNGDYLIMTDTPELPLLLRNPETKGWYVNPQATPQIANRLWHAIEPAPELDDNPFRNPVSGVSGGGGTSRSGSLHPPTQFFPEPVRLTLKERIEKQRRERFKQQSDGEKEFNKRCFVSVRFHYRAEKGGKLFSVWSGKRKNLKDVPWRLSQGGGVIASGLSDQNGLFELHDLPNHEKCLLEYGLPGGELTQQEWVSVNEYTYIKLHSFVLSHYYDDVEQTPVTETDFVITLSNGETQTSTTDAKGQSVIGPLLSPVSSVEFYPDENEDDINDSLNDLNQQLEKAADHYALALAEEVIKEYQPSHISPNPTEQDDTTKVDQVTIDFEQAVADKINELKQQSLEYDAQAWYEKVMDIHQAVSEGVVDGITNYVPDLGTFGDLLEEMKLDVDTMVVIKAITLGDVDELERAFQQWKQRNLSGYEQASAEMETVIILLKDPHARQTLLSLPKRFLAVTPTDALVQLGVSQGSQMTVDGAAVAGVTALGTAISGPGGLVAGGLATSGTLARKTTSIAEELLDILMSLSETLVKKRNKRTESVNTRFHAHDSETPTKGDKPKDTPKHCKWQNCKTKHKKPPKYSNTGRTTKTRSESYTSHWKKKGLEPWQLLGNGNALPDVFHDPDHDAWKLGYKREPSPDHKAKIMASATQPEAGADYPVQGHHIIPVEAFSSDELKALKTNITLIGWDINAPENGIFLPTLAPDMLRHNLQLHRGPHPKDYEQSIKTELKEIQTECLNYCKDDKQEQLIKELNELTEEIKQYLEKIDEELPPEYLLRNDTLELKAQLEVMLQTHTKESN